MTNSNILPETEILNVIKDKSSHINLQSDCDIIVSTYMSNYIAILSSQNTDISDQSKVTFNGHYRLLLMLHKTFINIQSESLTNKVLPDMNIFQHLYLLRSVINSVIKLVMEDLDIKSENEVLDMLNDLPNQ